MRSKLIFCGVGVLCVAVMWLFSRLYQELLTAYEQSGGLTELEYSWFFRLMLNLTGYATVLGPGFILYKYLEKTNYFDKISNTTLVSRTLVLCFGPQERLPEMSGDKEAAPPQDARREGAELMFCFTGLMGAYLVWGLLQEKIMTQTYTMADGSAVQFNDSQFLVFVNRLAALLAALARLLYTRRTLLPAPLYPFSYCALSNVVSAWCQYEALKYVSFPTQVLSKSCKVLPVMLMGRVVARQSYHGAEYATAALISAGMVLFLCGSREPAGATAATVATSASGLALLALYMASDSFTSSWQGVLFTRTRCRPLQMLCAVNLFSCLLTGAALLRRGGALRSAALLRHPGFVADAAVLSAASALGQLLIYRTIDRFGPVVFTIIMTLRQAVSVLLSCVVYGHRVSAGGAAGIVLVFVAVLVRMYCAQRRRQRAAPRATT